MCPHNCILLKAVEKSWILVEGGVLDSFPGFMSVGPKMYENPSVWYYNRDAQTAQGSKSVYSKKKCIKQYIIIWYASLTNIRSVICKVWGSQTHPEEKVENKEKVLETDCYPVILFILIYLAHLSCKIRIEKSGTMLVIHIRAIFFVYLHNT